MQTYRQTDALVTALRSPNGTGVIMDQMEVNVEQRSSSLCGLLLYSI